MQSIMQMLMQHPAIQSMIRNMQGGGGMGGGQQQAGGMQGGGQMNPSINQQYPGGGQIASGYQQTPAGQSLFPGQPNPVGGGWQQLPSPNTLGAAAQNPMQGYTGGGTGNLFGIPSNMIQR